MNSSSEQPPVTLSAAVSAVSIHTEHATAVQTASASVSDSFRSLSDSSLACAQSFAAYASVLTNTREPSVANAQKAASVAQQFFERLSSIALVAARSASGPAAAPIRACLASCENAVKTSNTTPSSPVSAAAPLAACAAACAKGNSLPPAVFSEWYSLLQTMNQGTAELLRDLSVYHDEFGDGPDIGPPGMDSGAAPHPLSRDSSGRGSRRGLLTRTQHASSDLKSAAASAVASQTMRKDFAEEVEAVVKEQEKFLQLLIALNDVLEQLHQSLKEIPASYTLVKGFQAIVVGLRNCYMQFGGKVAAVPSAAQPPKALAEAVNEFGGPLRTKYESYFEKLPEVQRILNKNKGGKLLKQAQKIFDQRCTAANLTPETLQTVFPSITRRPGEILVHLRILFGLTPSEHEAWPLLQKALETYSELNDFVLEGKTHAQDTETLLNIQELFGDREKIVMKTRALECEGTLTFNGTSGKLENDYNPLSSPDGVFVPGTKYYTYLFNDSFLVAKQSKKSSKEPAMIVVRKFPMRWITLIEEDKDKPRSASDTSFSFCYCGMNVDFSAATGDERSMWLRHFENAITKQRSTAVFGTPLKTIMKRKNEEGNDIPSVVSAALKYLQENGMETEGVFRISAEKSTLDDLRDSADAGLELKFNDPHEAAGFIKLWLRELPEPLLTYDLAKKWLETGHDRKKMKHYLKKLPDENQFVLNSLIRTLNEFSKHKDVTRMDSANLAIVIAPNILAPKEDKDLASFPVNIRNEVVEFMIDDYEGIFDDVEKRQTSVRSSKKELKRTDSEIRMKQMRKIAADIGTSPSGSRGSFSSGKGPMAMRDVFHVALPSSSLCSEQSSSSMSCLSNSLTQDDEISEGASVSSRSPASPLMRSPSKNSLPVGNIPPPPLLTESPVRMKKSKSHARLSGIRTTSPVPVVPLDLDDIGPPPQEDLPLPPVPDRSVSPHRKAKTMKHSASTALLRATAPPSSSGDQQGNPIDYIPPPKIEEEPCDGKRLSGLKPPKATSGPVRKHTIAYPGEKIDE